MKACKHEGAATEFESDAGSITASALNEVSMARRSFLGRAARWSAAFAAFGLGPEALMQSVSGRSIMSSAVAAGATRDRSLHPFPEDDPFNMPIGANAVLMTTSDPATVDIQTCMIHTGPGWGRPIYHVDSSHPLHTFTLARTDGDPDRAGVRSYVSEENVGSSALIRLPAGVNPPIPTAGGWGDRQLAMVSGNDIWETWKNLRTGDTTFDTRKIVRNRANRYSYGTSDRSEYNWPDRNVAGTRAWGGSALAGMVRRHEIETDNPHIPHALVIQVRRGSGITGYQQGDPSSPFYNLAFTFPANASDGGFSPTYKYPTWTDHNGNFVDTTGSIRMGMRFALDPAVWTDTYISSYTTSLKRRALIRAARDYGVIVGDETRDNCSTFAMDVTISDDTLFEVWRSNGWAGSLRRVAGAGPVHVVQYSHWRQWADAKQGWGGGAPRVPYSPPLAPLSGDVPLPPSPPEAPAGIQVTGARTFDGTG